MSPTCLGCSDSTDHAAGGMELAPAYWLCCACLASMSPYEVATLRIRALELGAIDAARQDLRDSLPPREPWEGTLWDD